MDLGHFWAYFWAVDMHLGLFWPIFGIVSMDLGPFLAYFEGCGHGFELFPGLWTWIWALLGLFRGGGGLGMDLGLFGLYLGCGH